MILDSAYRTAEKIVRLPVRTRNLVLKEMREDDRKTTFMVLKYNWPLWRRPRQIPPKGDWRWCLYAAGRGFGKTRLLMEELRTAAEEGTDHHVAVVSSTYQTLYRDLVNGPSGIMAVSPPWFRPTHIRSLSELHWPRHPSTGVKMRAVLMSGDKADRIRGAEVSKAFCDEIATWTQAAESFQNIDLMLRAGSDPCGLLTTTLKRSGPGSAYSRELLYGKRGDDGVRRLRDDMVIVHGSTRENVDLNEKVRAGFYREYGGTADEITELEGKLPKEAEGALWKFETIEKYRVEYIPSGVRIERVIVAVDPSRSRTGSGDLCGIITIGLGSDGHAYVYSDDTVRGAPDRWIQRAIAVAERERADAVIYEANRLGEDNVRLIETKIAGMGQSWQAVTARGSKKIRAEPIAAIYKSGKVHHVGAFPDLEEEQTGWNPNEIEAQSSPNRIDALVHGVKELLLSEAATRPPLIVR